MEQPRITVLVDSGRALLSFPLGSGADGSLTYDADQLLEMIRSLGSARVQLLARQPPLILDPNTKVQAVVGPPWLVRLEAMTEGSMFAFVHPAFGITGFVLSCEDVERMVRALMSHLGMVRSEEVGQARN